MDESLLRILYIMCNRFVACGYLKKVYVYLILFFIDTLMFFLILPVNIFLDAIASPMSGSKLTYVNKVLKGHQGTRSYIYANWANRTNK